MSWRVAVGAIVVVLVSGAPATAAEAKRDARAEVRQVARAYHDAVANQDADAVADLYLPDAWFLASTSPPVHGRAAIRAHFETSFAAGLCGFTLMSRSVHTGGALVVDFGRYSDSVCSGDTVVKTTQGSYVLVYQRQRGGGLKIRYDIFTADTTTPPASYDPSVTPGRSSP